MYESLLCVCTFDHAAVYIPDKIEMLEIHRALLVMLSIIATYLWMVDICSGLVSGYALLRIDKFNLQYYLYCITFMSAGFSFRPYFKLSLESDTIFLFGSPDL